MKNFSLLINRLLRPSFLAVYLFAVMLVFQVMVITKLVILYHVLKILFVGLVILLLASFVKAATKQKILILIVLAIILVRLPFFFHPTGLITMSDNALEALQSQEIQDSRTVPFYQFGILSHQGTVRYLFIAYLWDFVGTHYLVLILWNLVVFIAIILLLTKILEPVVPGPVLIIFSLLGFAFIETMFDFSLLIRGGIYLDALLLILLGMFLFDFEFKRKMPILLSFYFLSLAVYIQPIALLFAASFAAVVVALALKFRRFWRNAWLFLAGGVLGSLHLLYYELLFRAKPVSTGALERVRLIPLSSLSLRLFGRLIRNSREAFSNLFRYEFSYSMGTVKVGSTERILTVLNGACFYISVAVFFVGLGIALWKSVGFFRKKSAFSPRDWPFLFFVVLLLAFAAKFVLLQPARLEPRHNIDLLLLVVLAYFFTFGALFRGKKSFGFQTIAAAAVLLVFTVPHYRFFLKNTISKEAAYQGLMTGLQDNKVKNLTTDFNLAYPVYFLSGRTIQVSDSLGPLHVNIFFTPMRILVDGKSDADKAYLFCTETAGTRPWHKRATRRIQTRLLDLLRRENIDFRTVPLKDYLLIVPERSRTENPAGGTRQ